MRVVELHDPLALPRRTQGRAGVAVDGGHVVTTAGESGSEDETRGSGSDDGDVHGVLLPGRLNALRVH